MKPRICHIMLAKTFGGANRSCVDLCLGLKEYGMDVMAICQPGTTPLKQLQQNGVTCVPLKTLGWWDPFTPRKIRKIVQDYGVSLVHTHLTRATYLTARAKVQVPFVVSLRNYKLEYYRNADHYVPTTHHGGDLLRQAGVAEDRVHVIHNFSRMQAVDTARPIHNQTPEILAYGRFVEHKGFHVLIQAMAKLKQKGLDFRLTLGGNGPWREQLLRETEKHQLGDRVRFAGWIDDVKAALDKTDLFVLPSFLEPFGLVILESMARGVPVVATRTDGPREFLSDDTAWLCEIGDVDSLAAALESALTQPAERRQKADRALTLFREQFSAKAAIPRFMALYEQLLSAPQQQQSA